MRAGRMTDRLSFSRRDGPGGPLDEMFALRAELTMTGGREAFAAARLEGRMPAEARLRPSAQSRQIEPGWIAQDREGWEYRVTAVARAGVAGEVIVLTMEAGGALA